MKTVLNNTYENWQNLSKDRRETIRQYVDCHERFLTLGEEASYFRFDTRNLDALKSFIYGQHQFTVMYQRADELTSYVTCRIRNEKGGVATAEDCSLLVSGYCFRADNKKQ